MNPLRDTEELIGREQSDFFAEFDHDCKVFVSVRYGITCGEPGGLYRNRWIKCPSSITLLM